MKTFSITFFLSLAISIPNNNLFGSGGHGGAGGGSNYLAERHALEEQQKEEFHAKRQSMAPQQKSTIVHHRPSSQSSMKADFYGGGTSGSALDASALIAQAEEKKQRVVKKFKKLSKSKPISPPKEQEFFFEEEKKSLMIHNEIQDSEKSPLINEVQAGIQSSSKSVPGNLSRNAKKNASANLAFLELHTDLLSKEERKNLSLFKLDNLEDQAQIQGLAKKIKNQLSSDKEKSQEQYLQEQAHSEIGALHKE